MALSIADDVPSAQGIGYVIGGIMSTLPNTAPSVELQMSDGETDVEQAYGRILRAPPPSIPTYEEYAGMKLVKGAYFSDEPDWRRRLEAYVRLTEAEYAEVVEFASRHGFVYNGRLAFERDMPAYTKDGDAMERILHDFNRRRRKRIATVAIRVGAVMSFYVHLKRSFECRDYDNKALLLCCDS
jgi:hypothetical protein